MEDIVDPPLPEKCELNGKGRDDSFHLEGTMIFVVQLLRWSARFDIVPVEQDQVPYLVGGGLSPPLINVAMHSFLHCLQSFSGLLVYCMHPVGVKLTRRIEGSVGGSVGGDGMEFVVGVEWGHSNSHCD